MSLFEKSLKNVPFRALVFEADVALDDEEKKDELSEEDPEKKDGLSGEGEEEKKEELSEEDPEKKDELSEEDPEKKDEEGTGSLSAIPLKVNARTGGSANHWFWGKCYHDFAGMETNGRISLDYCHDAKEVVGFADRADVSSGNLVLSGALTPATKTDRSMEIFRKQKSGVPYQASIQMAPDGMVTEEVGVGATALVNGQQVTGPATIFRKWKLDGCAILPYGADSKTSLAFSKGKADIKVTVFKSGKDGGKKTGPEFIKAFGEKGAVYFAEGKTWEEAQALFSKHMADELAKSKAEVARLGKVLDAKKGGTAVAFSQSPSAKKGDGAGIAGKSSGNSGATGLSRFAASIQSQMTASN